MNERNDLVQSDNGETTSTPLQPMSLVDILDGMFSLYRSHFRLFLGIVVFYLVFGFVINLVSVFAVIDATSSTSIVIVVLTSIASVLLAYWVGWGLAYASAQVYLGRDITAQTSLQQAWRRYFSLLGSTFLYYLVVICLSITIIGFPFAIYFAFRWSVYTLPVLFEETTARNALRRSTELVKGTWWRVCGIMLAISLIALTIAFILQTSYAIVFSSLTGGAGGEAANFFETLRRLYAPTPIDMCGIMLAISLIALTIAFILQTSYAIVFSSLTGGAGGEAANFFETLRRLYAPTPIDIGWVYYTIRALGALIIAGLTMPIGVVGSTLLYFDLRIRKEAFDIEMQVTN